jgi:putative DNA primase/helicase
MIAFDVTRLTKLASECALGNKYFITLFEGNWHALYQSQSEADLAFCRMIKIAGGNRSDADYLIRASKLMRDKWDEHRGEKTYGELTLDIVYGGDIK